MRKDVLAALSIIAVGSGIVFWATRHHSASPGSDSGAGTSLLESKKAELHSSTKQSSEGVATLSKEQSVSNESQNASLKKEGAPLPTQAKSADAKLPSVAEKVEPAKKVATCFQAEYQVPETDIPQILDLGKDLQLNSKTVCVRVNGSPVAFQFKEKTKNQIIIGSLHESKNDVKVSYCVGVSKCSDPCVVKQDRFLAALGGEDDLKATGKEEGALSAEEQDLEKELASFQALRLSKEQKVFQPKQVVPSCQKDAS